MQAEDDVLTSSGLDAPDAGLDTEPEVPMDVYSCPESCGEASSDTTDGGLSDVISSSASGMSRCHRCCQCRWHVMPMLVYHHIHSTASIVMYLVFMCLCR